MFDWNHWQQAEFWDLSRLMTKPTKWLCTQRRLRSAWASTQSDQSSLSAWRKLSSLATHWVHREDSDQTGWMPRLIWVFAVRTSFCWFCREAAHLSSIVYETRQCTWLIIFFLFTQTQKKMSDKRLCKLWNHACQNILLHISEPCHEKTCLRGFRPDKTQTRLLSYRD